jgi:hypothetical protein
MNNSSEANRTIFTDSVISSEVGEARGETLR